MNFCWVNSSKLNFGICAIPSSLQDLVDELHENPVVVAIIPLVEFCDLVLLELQGTRDEELFHNIQ